jgi:hypothetical protein
MMPSRSFVWAALSGAFSAAAVMAWTRREERIGCGRQLSSHLDYEEAELVPALNAYGSRL